jgi:hypothetical protein
MLNITIVTVLHTVWLVTVAGFATSDVIISNWMLLFSTPQHF